MNRTTSNVPTDIKITLHVGDRKRRIRFVDGVLYENGVEAECLLTRRGLLFTAHTSCHDIGVAVAEFMRASRCRAISALLCVNDAKCRIFPSVTAGSDDDYRITDYGDEGLMLEFCIGSPCCSLGAAVLQVIGLLMQKTAVAA